MIYYFVSERRVRPMRDFLGSWGGALRERIMVVTYDALLGGVVRVPERGGSYIFTNFNDVDALKPAHRATLIDLHERLVAANGAARVLNDPVRSLRRYDLLRQLHDSGGNAFNAWRADDPDPPARFPAFVRHELRSLYQPAIARDADQYQALLRGIRWQNGGLSEFVGIEFCDTKDRNGVYRKFGAFVVGDRIVPRHIFFSRNWHVKATDIPDAAMFDEELSYLNSNPHADALCACARLAKIGYGRIDYGMLDDRPQIWEINTNAALFFGPPGSDAPQRDAAHAKFLALYVDAMIQLDRVRD